MKKRQSAYDLINKVKEKANLDEQNDFSKSKTIKLKAGKIKFQLLTDDPEILFKPRVQHILPKTPESDEGYLIVDCKGKNCPVCKAAKSFEHSGITVDTLNEVYKPRYPYRDIKSFLTSNQHFLICAVVLADQADSGNYLPKDEELNTVQLIQFNRMALNNLMDAYSDYMDSFYDLHDDVSEEDIEEPALFAVFDEDNSNKDSVAKSLVITCRITNKPYSVSFTFGKVAEIKYSDLDLDRVSVVTGEDREVSEEYYEKCVNRVRSIQNYFFEYDNNDNVSKPPEKSNSKTKAELDEEEDILKELENMDKDNPIINEDISSDDFNVDDFLSEFETLDD